MLRTVPIDKFATWGIAVTNFYQAKTGTGVHLIDLEPVSLNLSARSNTLS
jgi:hypothetical protein